MCTDTISVRIPRVFTIRPNIGGIYRSIVIIRQSHDSGTNLEMDDGRPRLLASPSRKTLLMHVKATGCDMGDDNGSQNQGESNEEQFHLHAHTTLAGFSD